MKQRLCRSRMLGWDRNPLRRRIDRAEAAMVAGLILVFLIAGPWLGVMVGGWAHTAGVVQQRTEAAWRQVTATVQYGQPAPRDQSGAPESTVETLSRWTAPDGQQRWGWIPASPEAPAGSSVRVWVNHSGSPTGPPLQSTQWPGRMAIAGVVTVHVVGLVVCLIGGAGRYLLRRRRLADWEQAWRAVEPQWTQHR